MDYVFWVFKEVPHGCILRQLTGYRDKWKIQDGLPVLAEFPGNVETKMDPNFPDNTLVPDCIYNIDRKMIVSSRLKDFLAQKNVPGVEYLPITVFDHKGKKVKPPCFIVHPTTLVPILKVQECDVTMDEMEETAIASLKRFVVDESALATAPALFRIDQLTAYVTISKQLAKELDAQGFSGNRWIRPEVIATGADVPALAQLPASADAQL